MLQTLLVSYTFKYAEKISAEINCKFSKMLLGDSLPVTPIVFTLCILERGGRGGGGMHCNENFLSLHLIGQGLVLVLRVIVHINFHIYIHICICMHSQYVVFVHIYACESQATEEVETFIFGASCSVLALLCTIQANCCPISCHQFCTADQPVLLWKKRLIFVKKQLVVIGSFSSKLK